MNGREVNILLTKAALRDPRMKRVDRVEQADMADEWATDLADVSLDDALAALREHYKVSRDPIMIADILERVGVTEDPWAHLVDVSDEIVAASKAKQLAEAGVTEEQYEARKHDTAWIAATFNTAAIDAGPTREEWL